MTPKTEMQKIEEAAKKHWQEHFGEERTFDEVGTGDELDIYFGTGDELDIYCGFVAGALWAKDNLGLVEREDCEKLVGALKVCEDAELDVHSIGAEYALHGLASICRGVLREFYKKYPPTKENK